MGVNKWLGQPYFLDPLHEVRAASTKKAAIVAIRLNFKDSCIRFGYEKKKARLTLYEDKEKI